MEVNLIYNSLSEKRKGNECKFHLLINESKPNKKQVIC